MQNEHRPRRSRLAGPRIRARFRVASRTDNYIMSNVVRHGVVMNEHVAHTHDVHRTRYANRIQMMHERHPVQLEDARTAVAAANEALMVTTSRLSDARGGPRVDYRNANREYRAARRALIVAEMQVKHIEKAGENLPSVPKPRISVQPYEVVRVEPAMNVAYPAVRSSARRKNTVMLGPITAEGGTRPPLTVATDVASRGVRAAEARSAARAAKMDAAAIAA